MKEISLVLIKPDAIIDKREREIIGFLEARGMTILNTVSLWCDSRILKKLYPHVTLEESILTMLTNFCRGKAMIVIFEGDNALSIGLESKKIFREKYYYGYYGCTIHASDSKKEFERELNVLLPDFLIKIRGLNI